MTSAAHGRGDTRSSVPETELSVGAVQVASLAFQTFVVTNEQVAMLSQFVRHLLNGRPCARLFRNHQGSEFVDVARFEFMDGTCCTTSCPYVCLYQRQTLSHFDSDTFSLFGFAFEIPQSFGRLLRHQEADLFCVMTDGPTSFKCDLTLMTSVTSLRSSNSWKRMDHKSPSGPCSRSPPVCDAPRHVFRMNRNLDVRLLIDTAEDLDGAPKLGSWNRLSAWHLASQETSTQQLEGCVA